MPQTDHDRAIALAGVLQAAELVREIARRGQANSEDSEACLESLLKIDAASSSDVYGGLQRLRSGCLLYTSRFLKKSSSWTSCSTFSTVRRICWWIASVRV